MVGASIYGFVDYKQNHNKKEFKKMYAEVPAETETVAEPADAAPTMATDAKKAEPAITGSKTGEKSKAVKSTATKKKTVVNKKKKRKLNTRLFSRGALEERFIEPEEKKEVKTDNKKTEEKEQ